MAEGLGLGLGKLNDHTHRHEDTHGHEHGHEHEDTYGHGHGRGRGRGRGGGEQAQATHVHRIAQISAAMASESAGATLVRTLGCASLHCLGGRGQWVVLGCRRVAAAAAQSTRGR